MMTKTTNTRAKKIEKLLLEPLNVFTVQDLAVIWNITDVHKLHSIIRYYLRTKKLTRVHKGVYAVSKYSLFELAQKLLVPSYFSFYTALSFHGIIFQYYSDYHLMALKSKKITVNNAVFHYHQLKEEVFNNELGIGDKTTYRIAGPERAVCDSLYLVPTLAFDSLSSVNSKTLREVATIYNNKRLYDRVLQLVKMRTKEEHAR